MATASVGDFLLFNAKAKKLQDSGSQTITLATWFDAATAAMFTRDNYTVLVEGAGWLRLDTKSETTFQIDGSDSPASSWNAIVIPHFEW